MKISKMLYKIWNFWKFSNICGNKIRKISKMFENNINMKNIENFEKNIQKEKSITNILDPRFRWEYILSIHSCQKVIFVVFVKFECGGDGRDSVNLRLTNQRLKSWSNFSKLRYDDLIAHTQQTHKYHNHEVITLLSNKKISISSFYTICTYIL